MRRFPFSAHALAQIITYWIVVAVASTARATFDERAFWVWNRADPLTASERAALMVAGINRLYWQTGEIEIHGGELVCRHTATLTATDISLANRNARNLEIIPVIRVSTSIHSPEQFSAEAFGRLLRPIVDTAPGREVQVDFDCPDRLLPLYAERLRVARQIADVRRLTITALASWVHIPGSAPLWSTVDAVFPMLYDTEADPKPVLGRPFLPGSDESHTCQPRPMLNPQELSAQLRTWSRCPIPWSAGLPTFARVTLYDPTGRSQGHLKSWDWEDLVFNPAVVVDRPKADGTTVLRAVRPTRVGESLVPVGGYVAWREAEWTTLRNGITEADANGAKGIIFFRLPDSPASTHPTGGGRSLTQLLTLFATGTPPAGTVRLSMRHADDGTDRWVLRNDSETDLPPRFAGEIRGYGLELEIAGRSSGWRDALLGDFHRVASHVFNVPFGAIPADADQPVPVAIPLARRLTFWFSELPAHATLTTGLVQLAPGVDPAAVRFRLPAIVHPESTPWQSPD